MATIFRSHLSVLLLVGFSSCITVSTMAQTVVDTTLYGNWTGAIHVGGIELGIQTHFSPESATIDIPQQGAHGLPLKNVSASEGTVHFELPAGPGLATFEGEMTEDAIGGRFSQAGATGSFELKRSVPGSSDTAVADTESSAGGETVTANTGEGTLSGTLLMPDTAVPIPLVILVAGSGPTDRDGNSALIPGKNNSLRLLAEALRDSGIATIRYDKRGIGSSTSLLGEKDLRIDTFAVDVNSWVRRFADDTRFSGIVLAGHSEGALLVSLAASSAAVDGVVTIAGAGRPATEVLHEQLAAQLPEPLLARADSAMTQLTAGETVDDLPTQLVTLFRPSIQSYLSSWFKLDPAKVLGAVEKPKLIVQGGTDIQVKVADAQRLAEFSPNATLLVIPGMNHILKDVPADRGTQVASYSNPDLPVDSELVGAIVTFVRRIAVGG